MNYPQARRLLEGLPSRVKPGLDRINRLLDALGRPEQGFPAVHIGGTNGKGSVTAMLAAILRAAGYRVGRFTSPDLLDFRDRIAVNGNWIPKTRLAMIVDRLEPVLTGPDSPTMFELLTAIAFAYFVEEHVDIAVVEVGLGGRYDATNVVQSVLSVLTNVDRDHMDLLGDTIEKIAWEKAGIAKPNVPFLLGPLSSAADKVVAKVAQSTGAPIVRTEEVTVEEIHRDLAGAVYRITGPNLPPEVIIPLVGGYERENLRAALAAVVILREQGWVIPSTAVIEGLRTVCWPGRFEVVGQNPWIILDGAHNLPGTQVLVPDIERFLPNRARRTLLFGILADKEFAPICELLFPLFSRIVLTQSESPRALPPRALLPIARRYGIEPTLTNTVEEGVTAARAGLGHADGLLITGSLTVVREARPCLVQEATCPT